MNCKHFRYYIERYIDDSLSTKKRTDIEAHFTGCASCNSAYREALNTRQLIAIISSPPPPDDLTTTIMAGIRNPITISEKNEPIGWFFGNWWSQITLQRRIECTCILLTIMVAGIFIGRDLSNQSGTLTYAEYPDIDAFSAIPKGSAENAIFQMTDLSTTGKNK
jgi:hypothetical protein